MLNYTQQGLGRKAAGEKKWLCKGWERADGSHYSWLGPKIKAKVCPAGEFTEGKFRRKAGESVQRDTFGWDLGLWDAVGAGIHRSRGIEIIHPKT